MILSLLPSFALAQSGCSLTFEEFLNKFEADREFQQQNIIYPLKHSFVDPDAYPEPKIVSQPLSIADVKLRNRPIFPLGNHQRESQLSKIVSFYSKTVVLVKLHKQDTGYLLMYQFGNIDGCWKLVEFEDASI